MAEPHEDRERGFTRLYRVEPVTASEASDWIKEGQRASGHSEAAGRWFVSDPAMLAWYREDAPGPTRTVYIDVPTGDLDKYRVDNSTESIGRRPVRTYSRDPANEFFLPRDLADGRKELDAGSQTERLPIPGQIAQDLDGPELTQEATPDVEHARHHEDGKPVPTKQQRETAVARIKELMDSGYIEQRGNIHRYVPVADAERIPGVPAESSEAVPFSLLPDAEKREVLDRFVDWQGFTEEEHWDVIWRVIDGENPGLWMQGIEQYNPEEDFARPLTQKQHAAYLRDIAASYGMTVEEMDDYYERMENEGDAEAAADTPLTSPARNAMPDFRADVFDALMTRLESFWDEFARLAQTKEQEALANVFGEFVTEAYTSISYIAGASRQHGPPLTGTAILPPRTATTERLPSPGDIVADEQDGPEPPSPERSRALAPAMPELEYPEES